MGCESITEFLAKHPAVPYVDLAGVIGEGVAALQIEWMQFEEANDHHALRRAAMDSLVRDLRKHLPSGWRQGAKGDFDTSGAFADWIVRLEQADPSVKPKAKMTWEALERLRPPSGWSPAGPEDKFIVDAFSTVWTDG
jgi:hypothetical protein